MQEFLRLWFKSKCDPYNDKVLDLKMSHLKEGQEDLSNCQIREIELQLIAVAIDVCQQFARCLYNYVQEHL